MNKILLNSTLLLGGQHFWGAFLTSGNHRGIENQAVYLIATHYLPACEFEQGIKYGNFNTYLHKKGIVTCWFE